MLPDNLFVVIHLDNCGVTGLKQHIAVRQHLNVVHFRSFVRNLPLDLALLINDRDMTRVFGRQNAMSNFGGLSESNLNGKQNDERANYWFHCPVSWATVLRSIATRVVNRETGGV